MDKCMRSYMDDCKQDPDLQAFDTNLQTRAQLVLNSLSNGEEGVSLTDALKTVISSVCELNELTANTILDCKEELWKLMMENNLCHDLVMDYFNNSCEMLKFCTELNKFLLSGRDCHSYIQHKIQRLQTEIDIGGPDNYSRILESLKSIMSSNHVSNVQDAAKDLLDKIGWLGGKKKEMLDRLVLCEKKIGKKLKKIVFWKKITNSIFMSILVSLAVFGLVGIALITAQPHLAAASIPLVHAHIAATALAHGHIAATALAHGHIAATALAHGHIGATALAHGHIGATALAHGHIASALAQTVGANPHATWATGITLNGCIVPTAGGAHWVHSMFQKHEIAWRNRKNVIISMHDGTQVAMKELEEIEAPINALINRIPLLRSGDDLKDIEDVKFNIKEIKNKVGEFLKKIDELEEQAKKCSSQILKARDNVLLMSLRTLKL